MSAAISSRFGGDKLPISSQVSGCLVQSQMSFLQLLFLLLVLCFMPSAASLFGAVVIESLDVINPAAVSPFELVQMCYTELLPVPLELARNMGNMKTNGRQQEFRFVSR